MPAAAVGTNTKIFNISELAQGFKLDRATVKKRLDAAGVQPVERKAKEVRYRLDEDLEEILLAVDADFEAERLRKMTAEADLKEMQAARERGETASVREFQEIVQALFGGLYKEIAVRFPKKIGGKASRAKTPAEASAIIQHGLNEIFVSVRNDFTKYLGEKAENGAEKRPNVRKTAQNTSKTAQKPRKTAKNPPKMGAKTVK